MPHDDRSDRTAARRSVGRAAKPAKPAKPASTQPEELTAEQRAALELQRAARQTRGKPPSI